MTRQPVTSSFIKSMGYQGETLEVELVNGTVHQYEGVTPELYAECLGAASIGSYFGSKIRGRFSHTKLEPDPKAEAV